MSKRFRVCDLNQPFLLPPSLQDWLPQQHLARFLADVTEELNLSPILAAYERSDGRAADLCDFVSDFACHSHNVGAAPFVVRRVRWLGSVQCPRVAGQPRNS